MIAGGRVVGQGQDPHLPDIADILVEGTSVAAVDPGVQARLPEGDRAACATIDARGKLVMPGFVNAHYHSHDIFLKGYFDPQPLEFWVLNALPRNYPPRSAAEIRARTLLGAAECIRSGITTVQDMVTLFPMTPEQVEAAHSAYAESGLRTSTRRDDAFRGVYIGTRTSAERFAAPQDAAVGASPPCTRRL